MSKQKVVFLSTCVGVVLLAVFLAGAATRITAGDQATVTQLPTLEDRVRDVKDGINVARTYLTYLRDKDYKAAHRQLTTSLQQSINPEQLGRFEASCGYGVGGWCDEKTQIVDAGTKDSYLILVLRNEKTQANYMWLEREDGQWRVLGLSGRYEPIRDKDAGLVAAAKNVIDAWSKHDWPAMYDLGGAGSKNRSKDEYTTWAAQQKSRIDPISCVQVCRSTFSYPGVTCVDVIALMKRGDKEAWPSEAAYNAYPDNELDVITVKLKQIDGKWRLTDKKGGSSRVPGIIFNVRAYR